MTKSTCTMPECERAHLAKGMCKMHYYRVNRKPEPIRYIPRTCQDCGVDYQGSRGALTMTCPPCAKVNAGKKLSAHYASTKSVRDAAKKPKKPKPPKPPRLEECVWCAGSFETKSFQKYCSPKCSYEAQLATKAEQYRTGKLADKACRECSADISGALWSRLCQPCALISKRRSHADTQRRRRARLRGVEHETINTNEIYARDGWMCGICNEHVDKALTYPHMMSASLDHIMPIAHGGPHTKDNVQLSHFICNAIKSDRVDAA